MTPHRMITLMLSACAAMVVTPALGGTALFAGGCFWSVEANFEKVEGVIEAVSGFAGGHTENPTYNEVAYGGDTGHYEVVEVTYDPDVVSYDQLLTVYWHTTDPTDPTGQFCDKGPMYKPAIFALDDEQMRLAEASKAAIAEESGYTIVTEIKPEATFYAAGDEHQDFYLTNPAHYERYRIGCGRDDVIRRLWGEKAFLGTSQNPFPDV
ncbi:peptide-methionine (S)-S-oxide reductase MsrA [Pelagibacterium lentulum]|uniref:Peptide methionine sulfoxide reductase MsrA n=1 Tax=Pelagibacterium lentulum TaxID=2029865 RepID=A0A916RB34_9HYPH|nr:peptide-methionine (S)-S-oxide reductase MsrA [Pelagibacterium lentulum]GGA47205.1 peptide methionine sulfoxide reductase MsrA [Pelagibacterium lentulum]